MHGCGAHSGQRVGLRLPMVWVLAEATEVFWTGENHEVKNGEFLPRFGADVVELVTGFRLELSFVRRSL